eukprot:6163652-Amphidinium_carterae.1
MKLWWVCKEYDIAPTNIFNIDGTMVVLCPFPHQGWCMKGSAPKPFLVLPMVGDKPVSSSPPWLANVVQEALGPYTRASAKVLLDCAAQHVCKEVAEHVRSQVPHMHLYFIGSGYTSVRQL